MKSNSSAQPAQPTSAQADLLGAAIALQPPIAPVLPANINVSADKGGSNPAEAPPAEDENQAAFITKRNLPNQPS